MTFILNLLKKNKLLVAGLITGSVAGYLYYYYVGCNSGTCAITSQPFNSTIYGAFVGALLFTSFKKDKE